MAFWRFDPLQLRAARIKKGWSLAELARNAGLKPPALSAVETHRRPCRERSARAIAAALGVALEGLAAPYKAPAQAEPRQLAVETFPTADDFVRLKRDCRLLSAMGFDYSDGDDPRHEGDAVAWADAAVLVHAFADVRERGAQVELVGFESLLEQRGGESHFSVSTLTPEWRSRLIGLLESLNRDMGELSQPPGIRAAAVAVADWLRN